MIGTIDEIRIEGEENGFHLVIFTDDGEAHRYRIGLPDQFDAEVRRTIGNWLYEGEAVRGTTFIPPDFKGDIPKGLIGGYTLADDPYEPSDPKSPDYHDTMSGLYDNREGK